MEKSDKYKRKKKTKVLIAFLFLGLISPKAWSYAEKELPPSFSEDTFSSGDTFSSDDTFSFSRAVLTDEKGVALCQVNLVENPQFLPQFAEAGLSDLEPLDLPECEEQSLDIVAQYAEQAWVKKEVAFVPALVALATGTLVFTGGCAVGVVTWITTDMVVQNRNVINAINGRDIEEITPPNSVLPTFLGSAVGASFSFVTGLSSIWVGAGIGAAGGLVCSSIVDRIVYE